MEEELNKDIKEKVFGYIKGELSIHNLHDWVKTKPELASAIQHIKDRSDIIFLLVNRCGLETSNFYIEEKLLISRGNILKNIDRLLAKEITAEEIYNWADDVFNWDLTEGYEDDIARAVVEQLSEDPARISLLTADDLENLKWHLERSKDPALSIPRICFIFLLPFLRETLLEGSGMKEALSRIEKTFRYFPDKDFFEEFLETSKTLLTSSSPRPTLEAFLHEMARSTKPSDFLKKTN